MVDNTHPLPSGLEVALLGLERAIGRLETAIDDSGHEGSAEVWIALTEALYWVAAADEELWEDPGYLSRRGAETGGRTVLGLGYARDLHTHELMTAARTEYLFGQGAWLTIQLRWAPLADLPPRPDTKPVRHGRDTHYDGSVAGLPLTRPLEVALAWLRQEEANLINS